MTTPAGWGLSFANPWLLLLLLTIPLLSWLTGQLGRPAAILFSSTRTLRSLGRQSESKAGFFSTNLLYAALTLLILALARPQAGRSLTHIEASGIDIMMVLDVSRSMLAEDFSIGAQRANRLDAVKQVTRRFIEGRPNDRIGIVAFAGRPYLVSPLTLDHDWLLQNLERLRIGLVEDGTAIGSALASATNRLKSQQSKSKVVVLLTDGDNNAGKISPQTAAEAAQALGTRVYTIGTGTRGAAPYPFRDPVGRTFYRNVEVRIDENTLKQIAHTTGGLYFRATDSNSLERIYREIDQLEKSTAELKRYRQYRDLFPHFTAAGIALAALSIALSHSLWRKIP